MENNKNTSIENLVKEADKIQKDDQTIFELMQSYFSTQSDNMIKVRKHTDIYENGGDLTQKEYGRQKVILKTAKRFCKVHASYVVKEHPNITIPAKNPEDPESNRLAAKAKKAVDIWFKEQSITRKLKSATRRASYKGLVAFYLSADYQNETFSFNTVDYDKCAFERVSDDPASPLLWFATIDNVSTEILKKAFPKFKDRITDLKASKFFTNYNNLSVFKNLLKDKKALYFRFFDSKYVYEYVNDIQVSVTEHNYPFIPFVIFPYFELDSKEITTLIDFIETPAKMINQVFGYRLDFTDRHSDPPLVIRGGNEKSFDPKNIKGGTIKLDANGMADFIGPKANSIDTERLLELVKAFMHFLSGLSEEAMAGFTGSLTAAGVSIELRLDSTVREALDTQIILQDVLQELVRKYLILMEKTFPNKNLFNSNILGIKSDKQYLAKEIGGLYDCNVSFGGILPRSQDQIVRNEVTKFTTGLISQSAALEAMNYPDPQLEISKIKQETIQKAKLQKEIEAGVTPYEKFFSTPEEENRYMFDTTKMAMVSPDQDHERHMLVHRSILDKVGLELKSLLLLHIQTHESFMPVGANKPDEKPARQFEQPNQGGDQKHTNERSF